MQAMGASTLNQTKYHNMHPSINAFVTREATVPPSEKCVAYPLRLFLTIISFLQYLSSSM
jgi:hypothetical protein